MLTLSEWPLASYACGLFAMMVAMGRDRNPALWLVAGLACGPLALLVLAFPRGAGTVAEPLARSWTLCPRCSEPVRHGRGGCFCEAAD